MASKSRETGFCQTCDDLYTLRKDGMVRKHIAEQTGQVCPGTGYPASDGGLDDRAGRWVLTRRRTLVWEPYATA